MGAILSTFSYDGTTQCVDPNQNPVSTLSKDFYHPLDESSVHIHRHHSLTHTNNSDQKNQFKICRNEKYSPVKTYEFPNNSSSKIINFPRGFSLKRIIFPNFAKKSKINVTYRPKGSNKVNCDVLPTQDISMTITDSNNHLNKDLPIYCYREGSVKIIHDLQTKNSFHGICTTPLCAEKQSRQNEHKFNVCSKPLHNLSTDESNMFYQSDIGLNEVIKKRQLSEPNSRLTYRYSHCSSGESLKIHPIFGNVSKYTPSLIDLRWFENPNIYNNENWTNSKDDKKQLKIPGPSYSCSQVSTSIRSNLKKEENHRIRKTCDETHYSTVNDNINLELGARCTEKELNLESPHEKNSSNITKISRLLCDNYNTNPKNSDDYRLKNSFYTQKSITTQISDTQNVGENKVEPSLKLDCCLTEYDKYLHCPASPTHVQSKVANKGKSLTKSISCYALKFFNHHTSQLKSRRNFGNEVSNVGVIKSRETKFDQKHVTTYLEKNTSNYKQQECNNLRYSTFVNAQRPSQDTSVSNNQSFKQRLYKENSCDTNSSHVTYLANRNGLVKSECKEMCFELNSDNNVGRSHNLMYITYPQTKPSDVNQAEGKRKNSNARSGTNYSRYLNNSIIQPIYKASTSELLRCLSFFIVARIQLQVNESPNLFRNNELRSIQPTMIVAWIRAIDRALLLQGWSEVAFINPTHVVFLYMMLRDIIENEIHSERELHTIVMACLYLAYSYVGNEISYPLRPFLTAEANHFVSHNEGGSKHLPTSEHALSHGSEGFLKVKIIDEVRNRFWQYVMKIINEKSSDMLRINADPIVFTEMFQELKSYENILIPIRISSNRSTNRPI